MRRIVQGRVAGDLVWKELGCQKLLSLPTCFDSAHPTYLETICILSCAAQILVVEVLIGHERPSLCSDVWSLGAVILQWMLERPPWDLQHLCHMYQYRHDRQASALHDAMDNQVRKYDQQLKFLTEISFFCGETTDIYTSLS